MAQATEKDVKGEEHWTKKDGSININMWNKYVGYPADSKGRLYSCMDHPWHRNRRLIFTLRADHFPRR
jgi:hypothetical protein